MNQYAGQRAWELKVLDLGHHYGRGKGLYDLDQAGAP
jgi:hypothetical protein